MNQRRHLLALARKGDQQAINQIMELYQVRVYSGDSLKSLKVRKSLPVLSPPKPKEAPSSSRTKPAKRHSTVAKQPNAEPKAARPPASKATPKSASSKPKTKITPKKVSRKASSKGVTKKSVAQPRTPAKSKAKAQTKGKTKSTTKARPTPASRAKRTR